MSDIVLLLTHRHDHYTVDRVAEALRARGAQALRVDTDRFPMELGIELGFEAGGHQARLRFQDRWIAAQEIAGVWYRHLGMPVVSDAVPEGFRAACEVESRLVLEGFLDALEGVRWMNPYRAVAPAESKFRQLRAAQRAGLRVPATLSTNESPGVLPFFERQPTGMVMKLQAPLSLSMDGSGPAFYTTALQREDLTDLAPSLRPCPPLFQERIPKACELRVIYVDGRCFAGSVRAPEQASGTADWRPQQGLAWTEDELPEDVARGFDAFMKAMGLNFGAADFIRTPDGDHVFLEINPCGEWGMLERDLGLPISEAIAEALLTPCPA